MSQANKIIKYIAIAFGIFLVVSIISGAVKVVLSIGNIFTSDELTDLKQLDVSGNFESLNIDVNSVNINIKKGQEFKVETNNKYVKHKIEGNKLYTNQDKINLFKNNSTDLIIYVPDTIYDYVSIENGAGKVYIESLNTKKLNLDLGAGKVDILNIEVLDEAEIDGGAGEIIIKSGKINNLDFDIGVGKSTITSSITGNSQINSGVGELKLNLEGTKNDYKIEANKGIGAFKISNEEIINGNTYGNGNNKINIEGGIGNIEVDFNIPYQNAVLNKFIKTYTVLNKVKGQEENSYYVTLQVFQGEVDTVLINDLKQNIEVGKIYEFSFLKNDYKYIEDNIDSIFENAVLESINETDKIGLDQIQDSIN